MTHETGRDQAARAYEWNKSRFVALVAAASITAVIFVACGGQSAPPTAVPAKAQPTAAPAPVPTQAAAPATAIVPAAPATAATSAAPTVDLNALEQAAKKEGTLTLYTSSAQGMVQPLMDAFQAKYGIKIEVVRAASGALTTRFGTESEAGSSQADLLQTSDSEFFATAVSRGWIAKVDGLQGAAGWSKDYWDGYGAVSAVQVFGVTYNTNKVKAADVPKAWTDLLDPRWKGQIFVGDPRGVAVYVAWLHVVNAALGEAFLPKLAAQDLRLVPSIVTGDQQLAAGEGSLSAPDPPTTIADLVAKGAPLANTTIEPTTGSEQIMGVVAKAPHGNAARLFQNFMMSRDGQALMVKGGATSVIADAPGNKALPGKYTRPPMKDASANRAKLLGLLGLQ